ncbi:MAG: caspase family protein [Sporosarcina sp.]
MYKALIIAVDTYIMATDLPNTINDANEIKNLLLEEPSLFQSSNVQYIHGNIATKTVLEASLNNFFNSAKTEDILFLYWAGHGALINDGTFFVPFDAADPNSMIRMNFVRELIDKTKANIVLSFFDTCHSGAIARKTQREILRGIEVIGEGKILIAACTADQSAWDRNGHGAFTDYLIQGLKGGAANTQGDIDIYNLYSFISTNLKVEFADSSQIPVMKSTLNGPPIILKPTTQRNQTTITSAANCYKIDSSGLFFLLGNFTSVYEEFTETDSGIHLTLKNISPIEDMQIKSMRNTEQIFAIHNEAYLVRANSIDIRSTKEGTVYSIHLQPQPSKNNFFSSNMSYKENGRTVTAEDIVNMRIERILLGTKSNEQYSNRSFSLIEHAIMEPQNSSTKVIPNLIESLIAKGLNLKQVRIVTIANLILTDTLANIEKLEFEVVDSSLVNIHLIGHRPQYYSNVPPSSIEFNRAVSIKL